MSRRLLVGIALAALSCEGEVSTTDDGADRDCTAGCLIEGDAALVRFDYAGGFVRLVPTAGGCATFTVPEGSLTEETPVSLRVADTYPASADLVDGTVYRLGPEGAEFHLPATLTLCYAAEAVADADEAELRVHRAELGAWEEIGGAVNTAEQTVSVELASLLLSSNIVGLLPRVLDRRAPAAAIAPTSGSIISASRALVLTYNEIVVTDTLSLGGALATPTPTVSWAANQRVLTLTPELAWPAGDGLELTVSVEDAAGNAEGETFTFTVDAQPPSPEVAPPGGTRLAPHRVIELRFDEAMDPYGFRLGGELAAESDGGAVSDRFAVADTLSVGPAGSWSPGSGRTLEVEARDVAGNGVQLSLVYDIDAQAPSGSISPAPGTPLTPTGTVTAAFSETMDPASLVIGGDLMTAVGAVTWAGVSRPTDTVFLAPAIAWPESPGAELTLTVADVAGNPTTLTAVWVIDASPPIVLRMVPDVSPLLPDETILLQFSESMAPASLLLRGDLGRAAGWVQWQTTDTSYSSDTLGLEPEGGAWPNGMARSLWIDVTDIAGYPIALRLAFDVGTTCGDSGPDPGEDCDEGAASATCDADCTTPLCGDGEFNDLAGEICDDGNTYPGDGCAPDCLTIDVGFECIEPGVVCVSTCTEDCSIFVDDAFDILDPTRWIEVSAPISTTGTGLSIGSGAWLASVTPLEPIATDGLQVEAWWRIGSAERHGLYTRADEILFLGRPSEAVGVELQPALGQVDLRIFPPLDFALGDSGLSAGEIDQRTLDFLNHPAVSAEDLQGHVSLNTAEYLMLHRAGANGTYGDADDDPFDSIAEVDGVISVGAVALEALRKAGELWTPPQFLTLEAGDEVRVIFDDTGRELAYSVENVRTGEVVTASRGFPAVFNQADLMLGNRGTGAASVERLILRSLNLYQCTTRACNAAGICEDGLNSYGGKPCDDFDGSTSGDTCDGLGSCVGF